MTVRRVMLGLILSLVVTCAVSTSARAGTDYGIESVSGACAATGGTNGQQRELRFGVSFEDAAGNPVDGVYVLVRVRAEKRKTDSLVWASSPSYGIPGLASGIDPVYITASATRPKQVTYTVIQVNDPSGYQHNPSLDLQTTFTYPCR